MSRLAYRLDNRDKFGKYLVSRTLWWCLRWYLCGGIAYSFHTEVDFGTQFIDPTTPVYGVVMQHTNQGTGGVYPLFALD